MKPGRNDPCPCGSGKKFKHCCLHAESATLETTNALVWRRMRRVLDEFAMGTTMLDFVVKTYGRAAPDEAWSEFSGVEEPFDPRTPNIALFMSWFFHRWSPGPHDTAAVDAAIGERIPTQLYLEREDRRLEPALRRYLEGCLRAPFSFHEVLRCDRGSGFKARDLFTGEERYVMERSATEGMEAGDILFGQLVDVDGVSMLECAGPYYIPPIRKIEIIDLRKELLHGKTQCTPEKLQEWDFELIEQYLEIAEEMLHPRLPKMHNTDGDPIEMHRLAFDIDSPEPIVRALADLDLDRSADELLAEAERTSRGEIKRVEWTWKKSGNGRHKSWSNTILGHLEIKGRKLIAEVNSARRALELRTLIESRLAEAARFRTDTIQSLEKLLGDRSPFNPAEATVQKKAEELAEHPEIKAAMQNFMAQHFEHWVSESIPALDGRTPLEAVRHPEGREKVLALVVDAERRARKMTPPVDEAVLQRVRERLGLPLET
jgi:hypothetical protein